MAHILEKFNEKQNLVKEYNYWKLLVKEEPNKLGRLVAILKREAFPLQNITSEEMAEYSTIVKEVEPALEKAFGAYLVQHMHLAFVDKQIHFHIIPRYKETIEFAGINWTDDQNPNPLVQSKVECSRDVLDKTISKLKEFLL